MHRAIAALFGMTLCASAYGHDARATLPDHLLGGIVQERDVDLVFGYLRDALSAAIQGREAAPPDELVRRAESMGEELKRRGAAAARGVIDAIEQAVREGMRDSPKSGPVLQPSSPSQRL